MGIDGDAISGEQIEKMDDDMLAKFVSGTSIFSRVNPDLLQVAVVYLPVMNLIFKTTALALHHWVYMGGVMVVMFVLGMILAKAVNRYHR